MNNSLSIRELNKEGTNGQAKPGEEKPTRPPPYTKLQATEEKLGTEVFPKEEHPN